MLSGIGRLLLLATIFGAGSSWAAPGDADWPVYGGTLEGDHYSRLTQIDKHNVTQLRMAWRFDVAESGDPETNPLVIGRTLYGFTPSLKAVALDAVTGALRWRFDAAPYVSGLAPGARFAGPARGLTYWRNGKRSRLFAGVTNYLFALDPATGRPIKSFGQNGYVDLRKGLRDDFSQYYVSLTTPGVIYKELIIIGFMTAEMRPTPPGDIRAYDVRTGQLRWVFHTIPRAGEFGAGTWPANASQSAGSVNDWAGMTLDKERGILYAPTSSPPDVYGSDRIGDNLFANTLLALDAATGKRLWHFQAVHHDLWDRDLPSPPSLLRIRRGGNTVAVVAQPTKQGYVYVFNRVTGDPIFPIEEDVYPPSTVPGEVTSSTQPRPLVPEPFARQRLTEDMLTNRTPEAHAWALGQFRTFRTEGQFVPFSVGHPTVIFPGFDGGAEWGGAAVDPKAGVIFINSNDVAWTSSLVEYRESGELGATLYHSNCQPCHGEDRKGSPPVFPSLNDVAARLTPKEIGDIVRSGRGRMPAFPSIRSDSLAALTDYLRTGREMAGLDLASGEAASSSPEASAEHGAAGLIEHGSATRFQSTGYHKFLDPQGYPAVAPPWGTLNAIDLNTGRYLWKIPLGEYPELAAQGFFKSTGTENYGGPILTASGLLFIGATIYDQKLRAFDSKTGEILWETELPYAGTATPATYMIDGKQYVVISTNNARNPKAPQGAAYVAYALP